MKKIIVFLLTAVLCLSTLSIAMAAEHTGLHAEIYPIEKYTPVIDGELDPQYAYSRVVNLRDNGPEFATGQIYFLWDDTRLYFYVDIKDSTPSDPDKGIDHETDCIELNVSLYNFDITADNIKAKQASDIGDSQFRVFRTKQISACTTVVDNGIQYHDGSHGGFGQWTFENTNYSNPAGSSNWIIHWTDDEVGYGFEGFVQWSPALLTDAEHPIVEDVIIGIGIQVNDDNNGDNKREMKCYNENAAPNDWSMSGNRATCGKFQLVNTNYNDDNVNANKPIINDPALGNFVGGAVSTETLPPQTPDTPDTPDEPETGDMSAIFALVSVISAGGFTVFATKKSKKD